MLVSIEALAMAGTDYLEWGMDIEEWEQEEFPPAYLLADEEAVEETVKGTSGGSSAFHFHLQSQIMALLMIILLRASIYDARIMGKKLNQNASTQ
ncbi:hypothetical protein DITRI_Ditri18aG0062400 [Diplodiscus trichospermus]